MKKGANKICTFTLFESNGTTPKPVTDFVTVVGMVIQFGRLMASYTLGDDDRIRVGDDTNIVEVEVDTELSERFRDGIVTVKLRLDETDAEFTEDGFHRCLPEEEAFTVEP